ncbi:MAG: hypothetical protein CO096_02885, partial [Armatimonadetes bacterium CG_4_9_14_3_um_filter_66_14]
PKPLMPILEVVVRQLRQQGFGRLTFAVGYLAELLMAYFGDGHKFGAKIDYSREEQPLGTAGPLEVIPGLHETFMLMNGDLLTDIDYAALVEAHRQSGAKGTTGRREGRTTGTHHRVRETRELVAQGPGNSPWTPCLSGGRSGAAVWRGEFTLCFPDYADRPVVPVFSSLYVPEDVLADLTGHGVYVTAMGDETMEVLNLAEGRGEGTSDSRFQRSDCGLGRARAGTAERAKGAEKGARSGTASAAGGPGDGRRQAGSLPVPLGGRHAMGYTTQLRCGG